MATEHKSAVAQLREKHAKAAKEYKCDHDVERVHHLIAAAALMRDWPASSALAAAITRELAGLSAKQADLDAEEKEELDKEMAKAVESDRKANEEPKSHEAPASRQTQR